jgi:hypothetical protein
VKVASLDNPVKVDWFFEQGFRLDPAPYLSGALEARKRLEALPNTVRLDRLTAGHNGGVFNGPKFSRLYLNDPEHSVPFLGSTDMLEADFSYLPRLSKDTAAALPYLEVEPGMSLISCSGTIGRMAYVRPDMAGFWSSQHVMKVQADPDKIPAGYLYTFLRSDFGIPMIVSSAYGAIIQHIEPHHLFDLPVPRFDDHLEQRIHDLVEEAAHLRAAFQAGLNSATEDFFRSVGLPELIDYRWHEQDRDLGFAVDGLSPISLRAMNFAGRAQSLINRLKSVPHRTLGDICEGGRLGRSSMFKRIEGDLDYDGVLFVGQRQAWWIRPEDARILSRSTVPPECFVPDETVMIGAQGLPSEGGLLGRAILVSGSWAKHAYTEHLMRVASGDAALPGALLYAFLRTEISMRIFRSTMAGSGPQSLHIGLVRNLPVPVPPGPDADRIAEKVRQAFCDRDRADLLEDEALILLTQAVEGAEV